VVEIRIEDCTSEEIQTVPVELLVGDPEAVYSWDMSTDPGWEAEPDWAWGRPLGGGGQYGHPDPVSGFTDELVLGYNLEGDYPDLMPERCVSTGAIDCSSLREVRLRFMRWLGVQQHGFDAAEIRVGTNGETWTTVWSNPDSSVLTDSVWVEVEYDISAIADGEPAVYVQWVMGPTNMGWQFCGWNIDDVEILGIPESGPGDVLPRILSLGPAVPNPATASTSVRLDLPAPGRVSMSVYDMCGRLVRTLHDGWMIQGSHAVTWDGDGEAGAPLSTGVYFLRAERGTASAVTKVVLLR
jgi:hypothetical protein